MKKLYTLLTAVILTTSAFAQAPEKMSYQAVVRDVGNALVTNQAVGMQISILQGSVSDTAVYVETQTPTTNNNGLVSIEIGTGNAVNGDFTIIDWASDSYFIKTEIDPTGSTNYTITGTSQLLSVPYALHAKTAESITGWSHYLGEEFDGGFIYHLYIGSDGLEHGLIVNKIESISNTQEQWQSSGSLVGADRTDDGIYNTNLMINSPAATFIASLGAGWYLPSIDELNLLWQSRFITNKALRADGGVTALLSTTSSYWSSTEHGPTNAFKFSFDSGSSSSSDKTDTHIVRAIKSF